MSVVSMTAAPDGVFAYSAKNVKRPSIFVGTDDFKGLSATITDLFGKKDLVFDAKYQKLVLASGLRSVCGYMVHYLCSLASRWYALIL